MVISLYLVKLICWTTFFWQDPAVTDIACASLNGLKMGDKTLTVRRATVWLVFSLNDSEFNFNCALSLA